MPRIIKYGESRRDAVAIYERDLLEVIDSEYVDGNGYVDPAAVLAEARAHAEAAVRDAYAEGVRRGMDKGLRQFHDTVAESAELLRQSAECLEEARRQFLDSLAPQVVSLAAAMAERIIQRETGLAPELLVQTARRALARLAEEETVTLRVNPADLKALREHKVTLLEEFDGLERLDITADDTIAPGGCTAESERLFVDARVEAQLKQLLDALTE